MITVGDQVIDMRSVFPDWSCHHPEKRTAVWDGWLKPHKVAYRLRIEYTEPLIPEGRTNLFLQPLVEVLQPQLVRRFGNAEGSLPHVYIAHPRTRRVGPFLCLFDDEANEWTPDDRISDTTIPWASNWLSCYESWLLTGWTSSLFPDSLIIDPMRPFSKSYLRTLVLVFYTRWRSGGADGCRRPRYIRGLQPWLPPVF